MVLDGVAGLLPAFLDAARNPLRRHPEVGAIVLECTDMPPHATSPRSALALPVYDIYSMVSWFHAGLRPRAWDWFAKE